MNTSEWVPEEGDQVRVKEAVGVYKPLAGADGYIEKVDLARQQARVIFNGRIPYVVNFNNLIKIDESIPPADVLALEGELHAAIRVLVRLRRMMDERGVAGFGDGVRWRADIESGLLVVREVKPESPT